MSSSEILKGLNPQQQQAVSAGGGPVLVLAGPGSGKTRVLTHRIAYLIDEMNVRAYHILAVTFTNKAAQEMKTRVIRLLGDSGKLDGLSIGTFHAWCARVLRIEAEATAFTREYVIFDTADQLEVMKQVIADLNLDPKRENPRTLLSKISAAKNELITPERYTTGDYAAERTRRVYHRYNELLHAANARDFDDLLMHVVQLFREHSDVLEQYRRRYRHVLVDEFQDTNMAQYEMIRLLAGEQPNLFVVGDPDQSIYAFRGADYRNVRRFENDFPQHQKILLEQNYRSHQAILDAAMGVIDQNPDRTPKKLFTRRKPGPRLMVYEAYNEDDEARYVVETIDELTATGAFEPGDFAIMYRTNAQSRALEDAFLRAGMPYRLVGATRFYARKEVKDALAYLRLVHNPDDTVSFQRIVNVPTRGIGLKTLQALDQWALALGVTAPQALQMLPDVENGPITGRARSALLGFWEQVKGWRQAKDQLSPADLLTKVLNDTGYLAYLADGTEQGEQRIENVLELRTVAASYEGLPLTTFLEEVSLVSDVDTRDDEHAAPSLMTLHAAKGLEFPVVFIVGLEENILPHVRSVAAERDPKATPDERQEAVRALEEERRLMYVGITRAEQRLYLVYASIRSLYGDSRANLPSRFLYDIPESVREGAILSKRGASDLAQRSYDHLTTWDRAASVARHERAPQRSVDSARFKAGDCVWHAMFGEGVVVTSRMSGDLEQVDVLFPGTHGQKTIIADFLKPMED